LVSLFGLDQHNAIDGPLPVLVDPTDIIIIIAASLMPFSISVVPSRGYTSINPGRTSFVT
jgi:hypothetical protein